MVFISPCLLVTYKSHFSFAEDQYLNIHESIPSCRYTSLDQAMFCAEIPFDKWNGSIPIYPRFPADMAKGSWSMKPRDLDRETVPLRGVFGRLHLKTAETTRRG